MFFETAMTVAGNIPNITPEQPPGTDGLTTALNWLSWIVIILGVAGFLVSAGTLAFAALMFGFWGFVLVVVFVAVIGYLILPGILESMTGSGCV